MVRDADYKAPRARQAALRRTGSGGDPFADFHFVRPVRDPERGGSDGLGNLEEGEEEEEGDGDEDSAEQAEPLQMQWEFEVRDGWEAFGPADQVMRKRYFFAPCFYKRDHFAKTGSGHT